VQHRAAGGGGQAAVRQCAVYAARIAVHMDVASFPGAESPDDRRCALSRRASGVRRYGGLYFLRHSGEGRNPVPCRHQGAAEKCVIAATAGSQHPVAIKAQLKMRHSREGGNPVPLRSNGLKASGFPPSRE